MSEIFSLLRSSLNMEVLFFASLIWSAACSTKSLEKPFTRGARSHIRQCRHVIFPRLAKSDIDIGSNETFMTRPLLWYYTDASVIQKGYIITYLEDKMLYSHFFLRRNSILLIMHAHYRMSGMWTRRKFELEMSGHYLTDRKWKRSKYELGVCTLSNSTVAGSRGERNRHAPP